MSFKHKFYYLISNKISSWFTKLDLKQRFEYFLSFVKFLCTDIGLRQANVPGKTQWSLSPDNTTFYHQVTPSYYTNCLDMKT